MLARLFMYISLFLIYSPALYAQKPAEYKISEIDWQDWDIYHGDSTRKMPFFYSLQSDFDFSIEYAHQLKVIDIDGMGDEDLAYINPDTTSLHLFVNQDNVLFEVFKSGNTIVEISRRSPMNPVQIITAQFDSLNFEYELNHYTSVINRGMISYEMERVDLLKAGILDVYSNMPPSSFKVIRDTPLVTGPGLQQLIRRLSVGEVGYATGSIESKPGEHWWKVYIQEPGYKWRMGWIRRANVQTVYQGRK